MSCMCGDLLCSSCGPAQGVNRELLVLSDHIEQLLDSYGEDASEAIAKFIIETRDKERTHLLNYIEPILIRIMGQKRGKQLAGLLASEDDYDEEFERWMDKKYPQKK